MNANTRRITEAQVRREWARMDDRTARRRMAVGAIVVVAAALIVGAMAVRFAFTLTDIRSDAMAGTLNSGDIALCVRAGAPFPGAEVSRGGLALVRYSDNGIRRQAVRRVVALAGDTVSVDGDGYVTLNGEPLSEPYAAYRSRSDWNGGEVVPGGALENPFVESQPHPAAQAVPAETASGVDDVDYPLTVPEGAVFVLCDNRDNVLDSRSSRFGLVAEGDILGAPRAILWPAYRTGLLGGA